MEKTFLSVVSPVYGDRRNVRLLYDALVKVLNSMDISYEIILVNDCCPYGSGEEIEKIALEDKNVKFIDLSRNFGQHNAIKAGVDYSRGDYVVVMDCDMQDNPSDIIRMYSKIQEGYDIVFGIRTKRIDTFVKKMISSGFRWVEKRLSNYVLPFDHGNFSIISKQVAEEFKKINNDNFNYRTILYYLGFKVGYIDIVKESRAEGKSGYNLVKGIRLATKRIIANSNKPLNFGVFCSVIMLILLILSFFKFIFDFINHNALNTDIILMAIFFTGYLLFTYLLIMSVYIGGIFSEVKQKPLYVVKRTINL